MFSLKRAAFPLILVMSLGGVAAAKEITSPTRSAADAEARAAFWTEYSRLSVRDWSKQNMENLGPGMKALLKGTAITALPATIDKLYPDRPSSPGGAVGSVPGGTTP